MGTRTAETVTGYNGELLFTKQVGDDSSQAAAGSPKGRRLGRGNWDRARGRGGNSVA